MELNLIKKFRAYQDDQKRLRSFFSWVGEQFDEEIFICVHFEWGTSEYSVTKTNIRKVGAGNGNARFFIFFRPNWRDISLPNEKKWHCVFKTPTLSIYEQIPDSDTLPLRFGLAKEEKKELVSVAVSTMQQHMEGKSHVHTVLSNKRFQEVCGVDVALWVDGELRGSVISEGMKLSEGLMEASQNVLRDPRFKPVEMNELLRADIEIVVMSSLRLPLTGDEIKSESIYPDVGYCVYKDKKQYGWYLPATFNKASFSSFPEFIESLVYKKARLLPQDKEFEIKIFSVENFIRKNNHELILTLAGPLLQKNKFNTQQIKEMCDSAAEWLCKVTNDSGYIPPIIKTTHFTGQHLDLARMCLSGLSLEMYAQTTKEQQFSLGAKKILSYCSQHVSTKHIRDESEAIGATQLGQYHILTHDHATALVYVDVLQKFFEQNSKKRNAILLLQYARLLHMLGHNDYKDLVNSIFAEFKNEADAKEELHYARYPELLVLTEGEMQAYLINFYTVAQQSSGAFPNSTRSPFQYVRGTGKIIESLAYCDTTKDVVERGFEWIKAFQYNDENMYHIPLHMQKYMRGGFRHDYFNRDAWVDAAAHVLIAGARYIEKNRL